MNSFIQTLRSDWHFMRILYLVLAVGLFAEAWRARDWTISLLGALFLYQSVWNAGCCAGRSVGSGNDKSATLQDTEYTEIK